MKRLVGVVIAGVMVAAGLGGCSSGVSPEASNSVCVVVAQDGALDRSIGSDITHGLRKEATAHDLKVSEKKTIDNTLDGSCATVVTYGQSLARPAIKAASKNTAVTFVVHNGVEPEVGVVDRNDDVNKAAELPSNVHPYTVDLVQGAELAGFVSAGMTQSGKMAAIVNDPSVPQMAHAFSEGAQRYNLIHGTGISVEGTGIDKTSTIDDIVNATKKGVADGVDIFLLALSTPRQEKNIEKAGNLTPFMLGVGGEHAGFISVGFDGYKKYPDKKDLAVTSIMVNVKPLVKELAGDIASGTFSKPIIRGDLRNGVIDLADYNDYSAWVTHDFAEEINEVRLQLTGGDRGALKPLEKKSTPTKETPADKTQKPNKPATKAPAEKKPSSDDKK